MSLLGIPTTPIEISSTPVNNWGGGCYAIDVLSSGTIVLGYVWNFTIYLWASDDGGSTWNAITGLPDANIDNQAYAFTLTVDNNDVIHMIRQYADTDYFSCTLNESTWVTENESNSGAWYAIDATSTGYIQDIRAFTWAASGDNDRYAFSIVYNGSLFYLKIIKTDGTTLASSTIKDYFFSSDTPTTSGGWGVEFVHTDGKTPSSSPDLIISYINNAGTLKVATSAVSGTTDLTWADPGTPTTIATASLAYPFGSVPRYNPTDDYIYWVIRTNTTTYGVYRYGPITGTPSGGTRATEVPGFTHGSWGGYTLDINTQTIMVISYRSASPYLTISEYNITANTWSGTWTNPTDDTGAKNTYHVLQAYTSGTELCCVYQETTGYDPQFFSLTVLDLPKSPTWNVPSDLSAQDVNASLFMDWVYVGNGTQQKYMLEKKVGNTSHDTISLIDNGSFENSAYPWRGAQNCTTELSDLVTPTSPYGLTHSLRVVMTDTVNQFVLINPGEAINSEVPPIQVKQYGIPVTPSLTYRWRAKLYQRSADNAASRTLWMYWAWYDEDGIHLSTTVGASINPGLDLWAEWGSAFTTTPPTNSAFLLPRFGSSSSFLVGEAVHLDCITIWRPKVSTTLESMETYYYDATQTAWYPRFPAGTDVWHNDVNSFTTGSDVGTTTRPKVAWEFDRSDNVRFKSIKLWMWKTGSPTQALHMKLISGGANPDAGSVVATSATVDPSTFGSSAATATEAEFVFSTEQALTGGSTYWLMLERSDSGTSDANYQYHAAPAGGASGSQTVFPYAYYNGSTWTTNVTSVNYAFYMVTLPWQTSTVSAVTIPSGWATDANQGVVFNVSTQNEAGEVYYGPRSLDLRITPSAKDNPTITAPTGTIYTGVNSVTWSVASQTKYIISIYRNAGYTDMEWTSGVVTDSGTTQSATFSEAGTRYLAVSTANDEGLWSDQDVEILTVELPVPTTPTCVVTASSVNGNIGIVITNPTHTPPSQADTSYNDIWRREVDDDSNPITSPIRIATSVAKNGSFTDWAVAHSAIYEYQIVAHNSTAGSSTAGSWTA